MDKLANLIESRKTQKFNLVKIFRYTVSLWYNIHPTVTTTHHIHEQHQHRWVDTQCQHWTIQPLSSHPSVPHCLVVPAKGACKWMHLTSSSCPTTAVHWVRTVLSIHYYSIWTNMYLWTYVRMYYTIAHSVWTQIKNNMCSVNVCPIITWGMYTHVCMCIWNACLCIIYFHCDQYCT